MKPAVNHPISDSMIALEFPEYVRQLIKRMKSGADEYGDGSFYGDLEKDCNELSQEALDISGWGFITWIKIQELLSKIKRLEKRIEDMEEW